MQTEQREKSSVFAINLGLGVNILLAAVKTVIGVIGHSPALLADGINSTSDVAYYIIVRIFMGLAHKPADEKHPYGHRQLESISSVVVGSFVLTTAVAIFWDSINKIYDIWIGKSDFTNASTSALVVALLTVIIKIGLTIFTKRVGKKTNNPAIFALAYDHRNDIFAATAASIGILLSREGYFWVDPLAGALVAIIILRTGIEILRESSDDLMDTVPGYVLDQQINQVLKFIPEIQEVEEIQSHRFGPYLVVNITIGIDGSLSVTEGDRISQQAEHALYKKIDLLQRVHVHYHPTRMKD